MEYGNIVIFSFHKDLFMRKVFGFFKIPLYKVLRLNILRGVEGGGGE